MPAESKSSTSRGCLHKLVVQNFKSYAGNLTLGPFKDFTCVIGPNGSGKSNLMDAVSFVVGVNTAQLRGTKLSDFRSNLSTATSEPTSVTLYYNGPKAAGERTPTQTTFTRTITSRDTNEWRVDGKKVDGDEYQRRLKAIGLLVKPRNFLVFQNEVEAVASKSPKQLTELLERICGSEDLKAEYESLQEKKHEASQACVAVSKRSFNVNAERKQLKDQVKEATTYQEKQDQLLQLKTKRNLFDLFHIERQLGQLAEEVDAFASRQVECQDNCKLIRKGLDKKTREKGDKEQEWSVIDKKVQEIEKSIKKIETKDLLKIDTYHEDKKTSISNLEQELSTLQGKAQVGKKSIKSAEQQLKEIDESIRDEEAKGKNKEFQLTSDQISEFNSLKQRALAKIQKAQADLDKTKRENNADEFKCKGIEGELSGLKNRISTLEDKLKQIQEEKAKYDKDMADAATNEHKCKSQLVDVEKTLAECSAKLKVVEDKNADFARELADARVDERQAKHEEDRRKIVDYLCSTFQGVRGRVLDLCKVKQRVHELAITVIMEGNMDSIVVEREDTAKRCIEYLREQRQKPMTFLPLDVLKSSPPDERLRMIPGAKLAIDLIDFDKSNEQVMWHVTANSLVVNSLEEAKKLAYGSSAPKCKIVTLDASIISRTGAMTGGDTSHLTSKAQRWQQQNFDSLKEKTEANLKDKANLLRKIEESKKSKQRLDLEKAKHSQNLDQLKKRKVEADRTITYDTKDLESQKARKIELEKSLVDVRKKIEDRGQLLQDEQAKVDQINDDVFRDFCRKLNIKSYAEFEGGSMKDHRERAQRLLEIQGAKAKIVGALEKLKLQDKVLAEKEKDINKQIDKLKKEVKDLKTDKESKEQEISKLKDSKSAEEAKRKKLKAEMDEIDKELKAIHASLKCAMDEKQEADNKVEKSEARMEDLRSQRKSIIEMCTMDEIPLPRKGKDKPRDSTNDDEGDDDMQIDERRLSHSQSAIQTKQEIKKDHYDYSRLPREHRKELSEKEQSKIRNAFKEEQEKLLELINSMNPNMKAIDQLKDAEARCAAVAEELKTAREASNDLSKKFDDVKRNRCDLFNSCFEHVKGCIDVIYKELTSDPSKFDSVGGSAYLTLNNQDEPYLDGIKYDTIPPGKRFMDMVHLSGGEKTVAALALLFAINSYSPAPFIVLDEVDAALDARNVAKVTRYIQARRKEQQCVIISLKERFYEKADALVGICRDISGGHSKVFTLDLTAYEHA